MKVTSVWTQGVDKRKHTFCVQYTLALNLTMAFAIVNTTAKSNTFFAKPSFLISFYLLMALCAEVRYDMSSSSQKNKRIQWCRIKHQRARRRSGINNTVKGLEHCLFFHQHLVNHLQHCAYCHQHFVNHLQHCAYCHQHLVNHLQHCVYCHQHL